MPLTTQQKIKGKGSYMFPESQRRAAQEKRIYLLRLLTADWRYVQVHLGVDQKSMTMTAIKHTKLFKGRELQASPVTCQGALLTSSHSSALQLFVLMTKPTRK